MTDTPHRRSVKELTEEINRLKEIIAVKETEILEHHYEIMDLEDARKLERKNYRAE